MKLIKEKHFIRLLFPLKIVFEKIFKHYDDYLLILCLFFMIFLSFSYKVMKRNHTILYCIWRRAVLISDTIFYDLFQIICPLLLDIRSFNAKKIDYL